MQPKTVLQPNASGAGDTSPESAAERRAKELLKEVYILMHDAPILRNAIGKFYGYDFIQTVRKIPKVRNIYENQEDQALCRKLRTSGLTGTEARDSLKMMGIAPIENDGIAPSMWESLPEKKPLPYFYGRRRF